MILFQFSIVNFNMSDQHGDTHSPRQHIVLDNMVSFFLQVNMSLRF